MIERLSRYDQLVEWKYLRGLSPAEAAEMERLGQEIDAYYAPGRPVTRADLERLFQVAAETGRPPEQPGVPPPGWAWDGTGVLRQIDELLAERAPDEVLESPSGLRVEIYYTDPPTERQSSD